MRRNSWSVHLTSQQQVFCRVTGNEW
ncbi:hypothetical protein CAEBREN_04103 [Caenorhabditis brenneri]|uniref:Uncharacterized protein n=1 Tax=Caenorhabditis brenneri TaxID=135651 RepID=G0MB38_CAEBE|nr:hypothetical protein CAEBREN_04103 [Caenorhabditis brenneri]